MNELESTLTSSQYDGIILLSHENLERQHGYQRHHHKGISRPLGSLLTVRNIQRLS